MSSRQVTSLTAVLAVALTLALDPSTARATGTLGTGAPELVTSLAPSSLTNSDLTGESSIGVDWRNGSVMYRGDSATYRLALDAATGSVSWSNTSSLGSGVNVDPVLVTEPRSGLTLSGGDDTACGVLQASTDDGASWLPSIPCTGTYDHPSLGYAPSASTPGTTVFYYCQAIFLQQCSTSTNGGTTWTPSGPLHSSAVTGFAGVSPSTCTGVFGHLRGSTDGTAYLPARDCFKPDGSQGVGGMLTHDDGLTWSEYVVPGATNGGFDPAVATTPDNSVYEAWQNAADSHPLIAVSHDHAGTWTAPVDLAGTVSPALVAATFPTLTAGDDGRIAYSFLGTTVGTGDPNAPGFHGIWRLYTSYSYDGGATWTTVQDTPQPVQYGYISSSGISSSGGRNLQDFIESAVTKDGRVVISYATGCLADCVARGAAGDQAGAEALSTHSWASVAYQTGGKGLFRAADLP